MLTLILPTSTFTHLATEREYLRLRSWVVMPESGGDGQLTGRDQRREGVSELTPHIIESRLLARTQCGNIAPAVFEGFDVEWLAEVTEELLSDALAFAGV